MHTESQTTTGLTDGPPISVGSPDDSGPRPEEEIAWLRDELTGARNLIDNLHAALGSARRIGAATGIVMDRLKLPMDKAFDVLIFTSQHTHRKLRDIADELLLTGELPGVARTGKSVARVPPFDDRE